MSRIVRLESENVKRISAVEITPQGQLVVIGGNNGAGKSSVIDSIEWALGGKSHVEDMPIRRGEQKAHTIVETPDYIVKRTYVAQEDGGFNSYLTVTTAAGGKVTNPQGVLDALIGDLSFDPLAFVGLPTKDQRTSLVKMAGLDFGRLDTQRNESFEHRKVVRREIKDLEAQLGAIELTPDLPEQPIQVSDLIVELTERQNHNRERDKQANIIKQAEELVQRRERELREAETNLASAQAVLAGYMATPLPEPMDEAEVSTLIAQADATNAKIRANIQAKDLQNQIDRKQQAVAQCNHRIEQIDNDVANAIKGAKFPIEGLAVTDDGITIAGVPFEQCSTAEQIKLSVAIGIAMNPGLRVLLVRQGSLLDDNSLELVRDLAAQHDAQVWMERVSTGDEVSVIIEDGHVKGMKPAEVADADSAPTA